MAGKDLLQSAARGERLTERGRVAEMYIEVAGGLLKVR